MFFSFSKVCIIVCLVQAVINISSAYAEHCFKRIDMLPLGSRIAFENINRVSLPTVVVVPRGVTAAFLKFLILFT